MNLNLGLPTFQKCEGSENAIAEAAYLAALLELQKYVPEYAMTGALERTMHHSALCIKAAVKRELEAQCAVFAR